MTRFSARREGMQPRERQDVRRDRLRIAAHLVDVRHALGIEIAHAVARHDHRQVAPARIGAELFHEVFDDRAIEAVADHHAVDVARAEIAARGLDRERADQAHALADRKGQRRIVAAAARDQHGRILERIVRRHVGNVGALGQLFGAAQHRRMQRAHAQRRAQARDQAGRHGVGRNW